MSARQLSRVALAAGLVFGGAAPAGASNDVSADNPASRISGSMRARYETLNNAFRAGRDGSDQQLSIRTRLLIEADAGPITLGLEGFDSRGYLTDEGGVLSATAINTAEILQAYVKAPLGEDGWVQLGRFTMGIGSQRLSIENNFRNGPNAFQGGRTQFAVDGRTLVRLFYVAPVIASPRDAAALVDNDHEFDEADWDTRFWGGHVTRTGLFTGLTGEVYVFGLNEEAQDIYTPGLRLSRASAVGAWDADVEAIWQFGELADGRTVDAGSIHAQAGYTFDAPWSPRLSVQYAWASGEDASDDDWTRFDPLYGGRRFDFGQTGIFGALSRQNLRAAGVRLELRNGPVDFGVLIQEARLASDTDRWAQARLQDATGASGDRIGVLYDTRLRWRVLPRQLRPETGVGYLDRGAFARTAPGAPTGGDPLYSYLMLTAPF